MSFVLSADIWGALLILAVLIAVVAVPMWLLYATRRDLRRWRSALQEMPIGAILFDSRGRKRFSNRQGEALLLLVSNAGAGKSEATLPSQIEQVLESGLRGAHGSATVSTTSGGPVQVESWPLGDAHKLRWVLVTLRDIGAQQQVASNYRRLIHNASHELVTPLTTVRIKLTHIEKGLHDKDLLDLLNESRNEIERLTHFTTNLLLLLRLEGGPPSQRQLTKLASVVEEVILQLSEQADERRITVNLQDQPALPRMVLDRDAWKQVFLNLIDNAIKYGKEGGTVDVTLDSKDTRYVEISVSNSGPGIAPEDLPHVFDEMYRGDGHRDVSGSGLGLAIVRRIVEQHGAEITCRSRPGETTVFEIRLPVTGS